VKEIRNIYIDGEMKWKIDDRKEILMAIAGLEDDGIGTELDEVLWRRSSLEEFEERNFTPSAGSYSVCKTKAELQQKEK